MTSGDPLLPDRSEPPPPSAALREAIAAIKPVRTRAPWRSLGAVAALSLAYASLAFTFCHLRVDLPYLPVAWLLAVGGAWFAGFALPLGAALLPRRGQVLPDPERAGRSAAATALALILISLTFPRAAPGHSLATDGAALLPSVLHCLRFSVLTWIGSFVVAMVAVRRLVPVGSWRIGAAFGAAFGALGGLLLHWICPYANPLHVAVAHGGGVALCALLGALIASRVLERG